MEKVLLAAAEDEDGRRTRWAGRRREVEGMVDRLEAESWRRVGAKEDMGGV